MSKTKLMLLLSCVIAVFIMTNGVVSAADNVVVVPLGGSATGNATAADVVKGKTFSSQAAGNGATGTLVTQPSYTNSKGMVFSLIPAGTFTMGSPVDEPGRYSNETEHEVTLTQSFYMQVTEVTNGQWNQVVINEGRGVNPATSHTGDNYPVETVNWYEATKFANFLSSDEGMTPCYNYDSCIGGLGSGLTCTNVTMVEG